MDMGNVVFRLESVPASSELTELWGYAGQYRPAIDQAIEEALPSLPAGISSTFNEAVYRAIFPGGKRIRPLLTLLGAELFGGCIRSSLTAAAAVEFIHTSSLIFDDLPLMDNASERRGEAALHRRYGEATATLVAISFLNAAYGVVIKSHLAGSTNVFAAINEIVECVGPAGMIGGQIVDLTRGGEITNGPLRRRNDLKTSSLIRLALNLGAIQSGAERHSLRHLTRFASKLGDAYQKRDDLRDMVEDELNFKRSGAASFNKTGREARNRMLRRGVVDDVAAAREVLISNFPHSRARECLLQMIDYISM
jgi:geranylgeranyl diphosphate synthase, type II